MAKLDKRHYVPAAFIGQFSADPTVERLRESRVAVHRLAPPKTFVTTAENVGFSRNLYRGRLQGGSDNDRYFSGFETMSLVPVDRIEQSSSGHLLADEWIKIAAFITSQFARNPDNESSLDELSRISSLPRECIDVGYSMNVPRVGAAVLRARWEFVRSTKDFILNDRAIGVVRFGDWNLHGYFIPLRKRFGVRIAGGPFEKKLDWTAGAWYADIPIVDIADAQVDVLNRWTWCSAATELYAASEDLLAAVKAETGQMKADLPKLRSDMDGARLLGLSVDHRRRDEMLLISLLGGVKKPLGTLTPPQLVI